MVRLARLQEFTKVPRLLVCQQNVPAASKAKGAAIGEVTGLHAARPGVGVRVGGLVGPIGVLVGVRVGVLVGPIGVLVLVGVAVPQITTSIWSMLPRSWPVDWKRTVLVAPALRGTVTFCSVQVVHEPV